MRIVYMFLFSNLQDTNSWSSHSLIFQTFIQPDEGPSLAIGYQLLNMVFANLWQLPYMFPFGSFLLGLLICLFVYYLMLYNEQILYYEKFQLAINVIHKTHTSLTLMKSHLEDIVSTELPEQTLKKLRQVLECSNQVIDCYQSAVTLDKINKERTSDFSIIELELYTYVVSVINKCSIYAKSHQVQLVVEKDFDYYVNCRINETAMTAALQHILNWMVEITAPHGNIKIGISHFTGYWKLHISNNSESGNVTKRFISSISSFISTPDYVHLRIIRKIIHLHGGKMSIKNCGHMVTIQILIPLDCRHYKNQKLLKTGFATVERQINSCDESVVNRVKQGRKTNKDFYVVLLVMDDRKLSDYLNETLNDSFRIMILENSEQIVNLSVSQNPDLIIIDEMVNGIYGGELCSKVKSDKVIAGIPVVLLINSGDNESYLSHLKSGADRLELRMINVCRLKADMQVLIKNYVTRRERVKQVLSDNALAVLPDMIQKEDGNQIFMDKVRKLLEKNLSKEGYTVDMLSADMGMCRTGFYNKIKDITGKSPIEYILSFKMNMAKDLLASQRYNITEIASTLGFCDAKYFGRKFKEYYHICPSQYLKDLIG